MAHSALGTAPRRMDASLSEAGSFCPHHPSSGTGPPLGAKSIMPTWWLYLLRMLNSRTRVKLRVLLT